MLILSNETLKIVGKTQEERQKKEGGTYTYRALYLKGNDGILYTIAFISDYLYNKTNENTDIQLIYNLDTKGQVELNDIKEVKK